MRVAITGASGLIGTRLMASLRRSGHQPVAVTRSAGGANTIQWDPEHGVIDAAAFEGIDAVVNLAGEPIGAKRWTPDQKRRILRSRVDGTRLLTETLSKLSTPPARLLSGSAIGVYGDRGDEFLFEEATLGDTFLSDVVTQWEAAAQPAIDAAISTAFIRTGIVLSADGGALKQQLLPFKFGIGGRSGSGQQFQSWIHIDDEVAAIEWLLTNPLEGPVNLTAPKPVRNAEFSSTLASVLRRPSTIIPQIGPRLLFGRELADTLLLESQRVIPGRLLRGGFEFRFTELRPALEDLLS